MPGPELMGPSRSGVSDWCDQYGSGPWQGPRPHRRRLGDGAGPGARVTANWVAAGPSVNHRRHGRAPGRIDCHQLRCWPRVGERAASPGGPAGGSAGHLPIPQNGERLSHILEFRMLESAAGRPRSRSTWSAVRVRRRSQYPTASSFRVRPAARTASSQPAPPRPPSQRPGGVRGPGRGAGPLAGPARAELRDDHQGYQEPLAALLTSLRLARARSMRRLASPAGTLKPSLGSSSTITPGSSA